VRFEMSGRCKQFFSGTALKSRERKTILVWSRYFLLATGIVALSGRPARSQAAAEYGAITARSGVTGVAPATSPKAADFAHLPARAGEAVQDGNRRALESHAGKDAAKLMLRSVPSRAQVRVGGKLVGQTPLLLVLAPGTYKLSLDGERMSSAEKRVDLLPHETREVVVPLESRYPTRVQLR
jgi:hypothetical protein